MRTLPLCFAMLALFALTGFRASPKTFDQGFDDGSAVRHSTTCTGRGIHFYGEWDSCCVRERRVTEEIRRGRTEFRSWTQLIAGRCGWRQAE